MEGAQDHVECDPGKCNPARPERSFQWTEENVFNLLWRVQWAAPSGTSTGTAIFLTSSWPGRSTIYAVTWMAPQPLPGRRGDSRIDKRSQNRDHCRAGAGTVSPSLAPDSSGQRAAVHQPRIQAVHRPPGLRAGGHSQKTGEARPASLQNSFNSQRYRFRKTLDFRGVFQFHQRAPAGRGLYSIEPFRPLVGKR